MKKLLLCLLITLSALLCLAACGGGAPGGTTAPTVTTPAATTPPATTPAETYTVSFVIDGVSTSVEVREGELPVYAGTLPADKVDGKKTYRFAGWDKEIAPADGDATYTAVFKRVLTVRWVYALGVSSTEMLADETPVPPEAIAGDLMNASTVFVFKGWDKSLAPIPEAAYDAMGALVYTAKYEESKRPYTATFKHNGAVVGTSTVLYGEKPVFEGTAPTKSGYNYCGWTNADQPALGDVVCESFFTYYDPLQLQWAYNRDDMSFDPVGKNDNKGEVFEEASGLLYMILEIRHAPSDTYVPTLKAKVIQSMKHFVSDKGCMAFFSLDPHWCYVPLSAVTLLASKTPVIWEALTEQEREEYDFMMKSLAYILNYGNSDGNNYTTGPGFRSNFHKSWNPNYRLSNVLPMLFIGEYLGGAAKLDAILASFSYDATIAKFNEYGWTRAVKEWTATPPTHNGVTAPSQKQTMENGGKTFFVASDGTKTECTGKGVRIPFRYNGYSSDNVAEIIDNLFTYNYSGGAVVSQMMCRANASTAWELAYILDGTRSPYEEMDGMMLELGKENRSSVVYARHDFVMVCAALSALDELGMYDLESDASKSLARKVWVGNMDYIYKIEHGYQSYSTTFSPPSQTDLERDTVAHYLWKSWWLTYYGDLYTVDSPPAEEDPIVSDLYAETFEGLGINAAETTQILPKNGCSLYLQVGSAGAFAKTVTDPNDPANKCLSFGSSRAGSGLTVNLRTTGGLTALGANMRMHLSFKLAKNPDAAEGLSSVIRLRASGTSDVYKILETSASGKVCVFGQQVATLTESFQTFVITLDFKTGAFSVTVNGVEKVSKTLTIDDHADRSKTEAKTLLEWAESTKSKNYLFEWYVSAGETSVLRSLLIDDLCFMPAEK